MASYLKYHGSDQGPVSWRPGL